MSNDDKVNDLGENSDDMEYKNIIPADVDNVLDEISSDEAGKAKLRKKLSYFVHSTTTINSRQVTPFDKVFTKEHCTQFLKNMDESDKRDFADKKSGRKYTFFTICIALLFITVIMFLFLNYGKSELIKDILIPILTFLGGVWGGYGYGFKNGKLSQQ